ncbi:MAG TPA: GNAT family N-acetyltransferase [Bacteroidia bacterium]
MKPMNIRRVKEKDTSQVLEILKPYILETAITFEIEAPTSSSFKERVLNIDSKYPFLIIEDASSEILAYAYANEFRTKAAYAWSLESTVYVKSGHHGKGLGKIIYQTLFELLKLQGFYNVYAGVALPNDASVALHRGIGFKDLGTFENIGYKFNQWHSTQWFQMRLNNADPVLPTLSIETLFESETATQILKQYTTALNGTTQS